MIRIEITIGRSTTSVAGPQAQDAVGAPCKLRVASPWRSLLPSAASALLFSFVATPNAPYAAVSGGARQIAYVPACTPLADAALSLRPLTLDAALTLGATLDLDTKVDQAAPMPRAVMNPLAPQASHAVVDDERVNASQVQAAPQVSTTPQPQLVASPTAAAAPKPANVAPSITPKETSVTTNAAAEAPADDVVAPAKTDAPSHPVATSFAIERSLSSGEEALINDVTALLSNGHWAEARALLQLRQTLPNKWTASIPLAKLAARAALAANAAADAVAALQAVQQKLDNEGQRLLAAALMQADRPNEAGDIYRALLISEPANAEIWMGLALALDTAGAAHDVLVYAYQQARDLTRDARVQRYAELRLAALA